MGVAMVALGSFAVPASAHATGEPLSAPASPGFELSLDLGVKGSEAAFGSRSPQWLFGVRGGWFATNWLELEGVFDFSPRSRSRGENLRISSTESFLGVGPSFSLWARFLRFHLDLAGGGVLETVTYGGDVGGARVVPAMQVGGGYAASFFGRVTVGNRAYARFHEDRLDLGWTLNVSWIFDSN